MCTLGHLTWPWFRSVSCPILPSSPARRADSLPRPAFPSRQTWGLKGFLISSSSVFGLTIGADNYLLRYEGQQRIEENDLRRQARNELAREGIIATETEIRRWKARREQKIAEAEMVGAAPPEAGKPVPPS